MNVEPNTIALDEISIVSGVAEGLAEKVLFPSKKSNRRKLSVRYCEREVLSTIRSSANKYTGNKSIVMKNDFFILL